jgi:hypothetical protein
MNLYNVSGESLNCYTCPSNDSKCADSVNINGLETTQCALPVVNEAASGAAAIGSVAGIPVIPTLTSLKLACLKAVLSGKKL